MNEQRHTSSKIADPYVSVIVPAYNAADYLERALDSALAQTMSDLEVVVVDDASSDNTLQVARAAAAGDSRVLVLHNERNLGLPRSRNRGIEMARGEWIALLDADDQWPPERLERMLAGTDGADVISDDVNIVRSRRISLTGADAGELELWSLLKRQGVTITTPRQLTALEFAEHDLGLLKPMIRRSFLQRHGLKHNTDLRHVVDFDLYLRMLLLGARWLQLPQAYYLYRTHAGSMSRNTQELMQDTIAHAQELITSATIAEDPALVRALRRRIRQARSLSAYVTVRDAILQLRFAALVRLLVRRPSYFPLTAKHVIHRLYVRGVRKSY